MHQAVKDFILSVKKEFPYKFRFKKIIEIGSKNINGSPRKYFLLCDYTGVDLSKGKGVDVVGDFNEMNFSVFNTSFDVCISTECLEHDKTWEKTLCRMYILLKSGGLMIVTCAAPDRLPHGFEDAHPECSPDTVGYYRNISTTDFKNVLPSDLFDQYTLMYARGKNDLQFYGIKK